MKKYHKIKTVFFRDPETNFKTLVNNYWACPEFKVLKDIEWIWTEKIHGTNVRIIGLEDKIKISGKADDSQIPIFLEQDLSNIFNLEKLKRAFCLDSVSKVCLYGEGYGNRIQGVGKQYISNETSFILFDCRIENYWLRRESLEEIALQLNINIVPIVGKGTLLEAIEYCRQGFKSIIAEDKNLGAEGLVLKPCVELSDRGGGRIIAKIKVKDFK